MISLPIEQYVKLFNPEQLDNIKSFLPTDIEWPHNKSAVAMDMGGTNYRIARVNFDENGEATISDFKKMPMPGIVNKITSEEFFDFFESMKKEYNAETVGLCFSYPAKILEDGSAEIITFSKEVQVDGCDGKKLNAKVLNDTTAAQLGTRGANMGLILGTGLNICYNKDGMIINSESGRFIGFPTEEYDFGDMAEQQVSGAYLRPLIAKGVATQEEIYNRAAKIVASEIYGIGKYAGIEHMKIAAEGSVFYNVTELQDLIRHYLDVLGADYEFLDGRDKTLIGAAIAALK